MVERERPCYRMLVMSTDLQSRVREAVLYDADIGALTWLRPRSSKLKVGDRVGWTSGNGARLVRVAGIETTAGRLIWLYIHGVLPTQHVEHINGDAQDLRLSNLRLCVKRAGTPLTLERLRTVYHYNPDTGEFLDLRAPRRRRRMPSGGNINGSGYLILRIDKRAYRAHRLAWFYVHGCWPSKDLDHANGNPLDNRIDNLREAEDAENLANSRRPRTNTSGYKGVSWSKGAKKWRADICVRGHRICIGYYECPAEAHAAYCKKAVEAKGEFARFA